jgi:hypothetical protein
MVSTARLDDDEFDDTLYDRRYYPKRVFRDGKGIRVPVMLTDGQPPDWMRPPRRPLYDASQHRPRFATLDARDPNVMAAERAYEERNAYLRDAWRGPGNPPPPALQDGQSARDQYIDRLTNAWRTPVGQADPDDDDDGANDIEALRQAWISPGATPGPGPGYGDARPAVSRETATKDAAADREQAYGEYIARISNGWRR